MTSEHDRPDALALLEGKERKKKREKAPKSVTPVPSHMSSSARESPAVQRDPAAQCAHRQASGTSLSKQRLPCVLCKRTWLIGAAQQCLSITYIGGAPLKLKRWLCVKLYPI